MEGEYLLYRVILINFNTNILMNINKNLIFKVHKL
jgi:hypothetical protein